MSESERVHVEIKDGVADVRLSRPEKMNALDQPMFRGLIEAGIEVSNNPEVRVVVLHGEGRAFCAGLDMSSFAAMAGDGGGGGDRGSDAEKGQNLLARAGDSPANFAQRAAWIWNEVPVPVIAAVHGVAFGGGLQVALGADVRIIAPDARMSVMEIKWGLIPDMSITQTLRHIIRLDVAKELTYTGRIVAGQEAVDLGLATQVSDTPLEAAHAMATEIASKSPHAIRAAKKLLDETRYAGLEDGLRLEAKLQGSLIGSPNQVEAVKSNMQKRAPAFEPAG